MRNLRISTGWRADAMTGQDTFERVALPNFPLRFRPVAFVRPTSIPAAASRVPTSPVSSPWLPLSWLIVVTVETTSRLRIDSLCFHWPFALP